MFVLFNELYEKFFGMLPPELRRALLFGLGVFLILAAVFERGTGAALKIIK